MKLFNNYNINETAITKRWKKKQDAIYTSIMMVSREDINTQTHTHRFLGVGRDWWGGQRP